VVVVVVVVGGDGGEGCGEGDVHQLLQCILTQVQPNQLMRLVVVHLCDCVDAEVM